ncbi:MAG TPA: cytochrome c [Gaiellales bacterium]|jgi:cytochrome c oxidase subunit 2|nr:cytochrome c [Gaiellales bacterium]
MIKVLTAALVGTIIGIIVMVVVIALSGTDTSGASSVGLGSLPVSTYSASTSSSAPSSGGSSTPTSGGSSSGGAVAGDANAGKAVFASAGCSGCHTLAQAGATGTVGPNLDTAIKGDAGSTPLAAFIKESIVDPDKVIAKGYTAGVMPTNFGTSLSSTDIDNLVALIMSGQ